MLLSHTKIPDKNPDPADKNSDWTDSYPDSTDPDPIQMRIPPLPSDL
jgi:hypothetical protein